MSRKAEAIVRSWGIPLPAVMFALCVGLVALWLRVSGEK